MRGRFVLRLLDAADGLLGWTEVLARPCPGGAFHADDAVGLVVDRDGQAASVTVHWTELDIARRVTVPVMAVRAGVRLRLDWPENIVWRVHGEADVPRPPVTVRRDLTLSLRPGESSAAAV